VDVLAEDRYTRSRPSTLMQGGAPDLNVARPIAKSLGADSEQSGGSRWPAPTLVAKQEVDQRTFTW